MRTVTCPNCEADNPADALVCENCGTPLLSHNVNEENQITTDEPITGETEQLMDWLKDLEPAEEPSQKATSDSGDISEDEIDANSLADWLADLSSQKGELGEVGEPEDISDWFDDADDISEEPENEPAKLDQTAPLADHHEIEGIPEQLASGDLPEWLKTEQPAWTEESSFEEYEADYESREQPLENNIHPTKAIRSGSEEGVPAEFSSSISGENPPSSETPPLMDELPSQTLEDPADWYSELGVTDVESALDELLDEHGEFGGEITSDEWIGLDDEIPEAEGEPAAQSSFLEEKPDLSDSEIPDWLESLKPEELVDPSAVGQPVETSGPLIGLKGVIPLVAVAPEPIEPGITPTYTMSKGQLQQVALLEQLTKAEPPAISTEVRHETGDSFITFRLVIGLLLLIVVIAGWFLPPIKEILPGWVMQPVPTYTEAAYTELDIVSGKPVLMAFEYTPAMAGELDPIAISLLQRLAANGSTVFTISQSAAGIPVADRVAKQVEGLDSQALGYLPGDAIGLRNFAGCINAAVTCANVTGLSMEGETQSLLGQIGLIIVLSGERDAIVNWIEQVGGQVELPMIGGITQAMNPVAAPYIASSQLAGVVGGLPAVAAIEQKASGDENIVVDAMNSVTLAQWMAVVVLVVGALFYGLAGFVPPGTKKQA